MTAKIKQSNHRLGFDAAIQATIAANPALAAAIKATDARTKQKKQYAPKGVVIKQQYGSHRKILGLSGIKPSTIGGNSTRSIEAQAILNQLRKKQGNKV